MEAQKWLVWGIWLLGILDLVVGEGGEAGLDRNVEGTIVFATVGRPQYAFDIFAVRVGKDLGKKRLRDDELVEDRLTGGSSVSYNGYLVEGADEVAALLPLMSNDSRGNLVASKSGNGLLFYVSEIDGAPEIYIDIPLGKSADRFLSLADTSAEKGSQSRLTHKVQHFRNVRKSEILIRKQERGNNLFSTGNSWSDDRPSFAAGKIVLASTQEDPKKPRQSWTAVYSTSLADPTFVRLTPEGIADYSPSISPNGEWVMAASTGERGWEGETSELNTDLYLYKANDGSQRRLVKKHGGWPSWADNSTVFFHRKAEDGWWSVYRLKLADTFFSNGIGEVWEERVTPPGVHAMTPAASQGGKWIAVATRRIGKNFRHIEIFDLETKSFLKLTERISPTRHHYNPFVSTLSNTIGYHRCRGNNEGGPSESSIPNLEPIHSPLPNIALLRLIGAFPSFSPDGSRIAFVGAGGVYVMNLDGTGRQKVFSGSAFGTGWDWQRKGIIYTSYGPTFAPESGTVHIASISIADNERGPTWKQLTRDGTTNNAFPSSSPDGQHIVFRSGRSGHKNLYIMDAIQGEVGGLFRLTNGAWTDTMCNWSPSGEWIAFASDRSNPGAGSFSVYLIHPDGTGLHMVLHSGESGRVNHPWFSPDSKSIVFTSDYAAVSAEPISVPNQFQPYGEIFISTVDGSNLQRLTHNAYEDGTPAWAPSFLPSTNVSTMGEEISCRFDDSHWLQSSSKNFLTAIQCH